MLNKKMYVAVYKWILGLEHSKCSIKELKTEEEWKKIITIVYLFIFNIRSIWGVQSTFVNKLGLSTQTKGHEYDPRNWASRDKIGTKWLVLCCFGPELLVGGGNARKRNVIFVKSSSPLAWSYRKRRKLILGLKGNNVSEMFESVNKSSGLLTHDRYDRKRCAGVFHTKWEVTKGLIPSV